MANLGQTNNQSAVSRYLSPTRLGGSPTASDQTTSSYKAKYGSGQTTPVTPKVPDQSTSLIGDVGREMLSGTIGVGSGYIEQGRKLGLISPERATAWQQEGAKVSEKIASHLSPEQKAANAVETFDKEGNFTMPPLRKLGGQLAESTPAMLGMVLPAAGITKGLQAVGVAKGVAGALGASTAEGLDTGAQNASDARLKTLNVPIEKLRASQAFQTELAKQDQSLPLDQREALAHTAIADQVANQVYKETAVSTGGIGLVTGGGALGKILGGQSVTNNILKTVGKDVAAEMFQEAPQSGAEQLIQNKAQRDFVDPNQSLMEGVPTAAVEGGLVGGLTGGVMGGAHHIASSTGSPTAKQEVVNPLTGAEFSDKGTKTAYSTYINTFTSTKDPSSPIYQAGYEASVRALQATITSEKAKTADTTKEENGDPIKVLEANKLYNL